MNRLSIVRVALAGLAASTFVACTDSSGDDGAADSTSGSSNATAGTGGSGGAMGTAGKASAGSGTAGISSGGSTNGGAGAGGAGGSGTSAGGSSSGAPATGGTGGQSSGGAGGAGAGGTGGATSGGSSGSGGTEAPGGAAGTGGTSNTSGMGGTTPDGPPTDPVPSEGCGRATAPDPCDTSGSPCTMEINGKEREFYVVLPDDYDAREPYPVVFQWHPLGGNAEQGMNMYRVRPEFPEAIYVTPDGLPALGGSNQGFANTDGEDEALTRAIMAEIEGKYCVDKARYYSTGFSYGGSMSYTCACNMSDVFRAVGAMAGAPISGAHCETQAPERRVAFWGTHGTADTALPMDLALPIRDAFVEKNGCSMTTHPVEPSPCVEYEGCADGYPVVWCPREGDGHAIPSFAAKAISDFFKQF